jgi:hypothetical protein
MALTIIICLMANGKEFRKNLMGNVVFSIATLLLSFFWCPMAALSLIIALILVELFAKISMRIRDSDVPIFIVGTIVLLIISCVIIPGLYSVPSVDSRELIKEQKLIALGEDVRFAGKPLFLSANVVQEDYYDYRYVESSGYKNGRISKFIPHIEESDNLNNTGRMLFYQRYKTYQAQSIWDRIWEFLYNPNGKVAQGDQEIDIYVPNGTVDKTIKV